MLGAAACERCGWSPLGAAPVPPAQDLGGGDPFVGGDSPAPTFTPPPPPPPGSTPPPPGQTAFQVQGAQPKAVPQGKSSGCGCLSLDKCALLNPDDEAATHGAGAQYLHHDP